MPRRDDVHKILIIGSGPIVISQACEFDYSGTQACKALQEEGYHVILVNSNPATIMTDQTFADRTYIEPITPEVVEKIIAVERPDALLPTMGGQTALNMAVKVADAGVLDKYGVKMIGADQEAIKKAEDRELFGKAMAGIGLEVPQGGYARNVEEAKAVAHGIGFPIVIRPSFTLGGTGGSVAYNIEEFEPQVAYALQCSMNSEVLIERSVLGWKEIELEVMRDLDDNVVIICSIENVDPMGIHTGDSITVAPVQTLTNREYQYLRDASIAIIREIGVETGGSNIQFAVNPEDGRVVVIEMNPRVSRSSALASKATGFPIAKIAAKLAVGLRLDEIPNDITRETPAAFEPTIDYCVVKIPRFAFEKFPGADTTLTTHMKSVGETMAIARNFREALQKALRGLEIGAEGLFDRQDPSAEEIRAKLLRPCAERIFYIRHAFRSGMTVSEVNEATAIDPWFLSEMRRIVETEAEISGGRAEWVALAERISPQLHAKAKRSGFSDKQIARLLGSTEPDARELRTSRGIRPVYKLVDTCAGEFEAYTPYYYSTYDEEDEARVSSRRKIMILGGGPNRIGQGIEFDYCCVHAAFAMRELGFETIMVNSNPETVSTDYDTSDKLYFEPLTFEDVMNIIESERPEGVIVQFGGQTPLNLAVPLEKAGAPIIGTSPDSIDRAEDRRRFAALLDKLGLVQTANGTARSAAEALEVAGDIGYPVLVRPSYVLGGRAMRIVYDAEGLAAFTDEAAAASPSHPILIDRFLDDAIEVDVDAVGDGTEYVVGGIMEHIEEAGVHSGDSACALPPFSLSDETMDEIRAATTALARELNVIGLMNVQYAVKDGRVYVLEVNPRASRTVPFVSKAIGVPLAKIAAKAMVGVSLSDQGFTREIVPDHVCVKEAVFPFSRFAGVDTVLGPEMRSTGEVMGIADDFGMAFAKSQMGSGLSLPLSGRVFVSVTDGDKRGIIGIARRLVDLGFALVATSGTAKVLSRNGIHADVIMKVHEGRPNVLDMVKNGEVDLIINTPTGKQPKVDQVSIRSVAASRGTPCITMLSSASAAVDGIAALRRHELHVRAIQDFASSGAERGLGAR